MCSKPPQVVLVIACCFELTFHSTFLAMECSTGFIGIGLGVDVATAGCAGSVVVVLEPGNSPSIPNLEPYEVNTTSPMEA